MYRNESEIKDVTGRDPHRVIQKVLGMVDFPSSDRDYFYALAAVDRAGNVGALSANAKVHVDKVAPGKPLEFRVNQTQTGVVHLSWKPPEGEKALFYNVYLAKHPILTTEGLTPRNPGVTWTEIYGTPKENGLYYFAVTAVDAALNEGEPCESVLLDYKTIAPYAQFFLEPDIWLRNGDYKATLRTSKDLVEPPTVTIHTAEEKTIPLVFEGDGSLWRATVTIDDSYREGTYGLRFHGKDAEGNVGDEVQRGPLFHVDKTAPESPGELKIKPDDRGTPGAVFLEWVTPKRADAQTEVPHFYNIYRSETRIESLDGLAPIHTKKVKFENIDNYDYTDKPPANGTYFYAVTSLDMARNESGPSNVFEVTVQSDSPRATLDYAYVADGKTSPVARDEEGLPVFGKGVVRVTLTATSPLAAAPKLAWHPKRQEDQLHPIALTGEGSTWQGDFQVELDAEGTQTAILVFEGTSVGGTKGTFIRQGGAVRLDGEGPEAEIIIPDAYRMLVNVKTNELEAPPVHGGRVALTLTTKEDLARAPALSYTFGDGKKIPVPVAGFGREWRGWMDIPLDADGLEGTYQYEGVDRAGNASTAIAKRRYPYDVDDTVIPPRKIANYATTGGKFRADASAPDAPSDIETEMRKLGVAVIKWKEPDGEPWTYNLYRAYTPITSIDNLKPVATKIYATVMVDAPPVDGNYYYAVSAVDMAGNESPVSNSASVFIDTIKPELKIKAAPLGDDFVIFFDEDEPPELTLTINFPGQRPTTVELGGSSGKLEKYPVRTFPDGRRGFVLPEQAKFFNGRVEVIVHSPDPEGNRVEEKTEVEYKKIATATGGEVESADAQVQLVIPPGIIPQGPNEGKRIGGYENLFFIQYANIPDKKPTTEPGKKRRRDEVDPIRPGLEVIGVPYRIEMNQPPEEPIELKAS
ncbi:fibronectin type III domain-containing protein, partial [bacterium]|nr:fibronectin type III domain-containing protein [bacterium]